MTAESICTELMKKIRVNKVISTRRADIKLIDLVFISSLSMFNEQLNIF